MKKSIRAAVLVASAWWAVPAVAQGVLPPNHTLEVSPAVAAAVNPAGIVRVNADIAARVGGWTGVRSCNDAARAQQHFRAAFNAWLGEQVTAHPNMRLLGWGWSPGNWWYENRTRRNVRSCKGGVSLAPVFVDFF